MKYDLEWRLVKFSKEILRTVKKITITQMNSNIINQLLRSATSIWANYHEANWASSKKDFRNKIYICRKEAQETYYRLDLLLDIEEIYNEELKALFKEAKELILIFNKISSSLKDKTVV